MARISSHNKNLEEIGIDEEHGTDFGMTCITITSTLAILSQKW